MDDDEDAAPDRPESRTAAPKPVRPTLGLGRLRRNVRDELPFVTVVLIVALGFCYTLASGGHWLRGVAVIAAGMVIAAVLRAVLPVGTAGLLAVRNRLFDVVCYLALGLAVFVFGILVPQ